MRAKNGTDWDGEWYYRSTDGLWRNRRTGQLARSLPGRKGVGSKTGVKEDTNYHVYGHDPGRVTLRKHFGG